MSVPIAAALERDLALRFEAGPMNLLADIAALAAEGVEPPPNLAGPTAQAPPPNPAITAIHGAIGRLVAVEPAAILDALDALLVAPSCALALRWLEAVGALKVLLPEVAALIGFHVGSPRPHKDLWDHTLKVLERVPAEVDLRWVALAHDIGKCSTRAVLADGTLAFHRHEAVGARLFIGLGARLGMAPERAARVAFVIGHHGRTNQFEHGWSDRALRRLQRECGDHLPLMLAFSAADWTTKHRSKSGRILALQAELQARLARLEAEDRAPALPRGTSEALMRLTGRGPGAWLAEARKTLLVHPALGTLGPEELARAWCADTHAD